jgi:chaperone modulatory protein CbpM
MSKHKTITTVILRDEISLTAIEVCEQCELSEQALIELLEHGILSDMLFPSIKTMRFNGEHVARLQSASRLQQDLNLNTPGAVLALELFDELEALRQEIQILKRHLHQE